MHISEKYSGHFGKKGKKDSKAFCGFNKHNADLLNKGGRSKDSEMLKTAF